MEIKKFIKMDLNGVKKYDFTHDVCDMYILKNKKNNKDKANDKFYEYKKTKNIDRFISYRQFYSKYKISLDPDTNSILLQQIYKKLWDNEFIDKNCVKKDNTYYSDTLTSAYTRLKNCIIATKKELNINIKKFSSKNVIRKYKNDEYFKKCLDGAKQFKEVREMIGKYHTLGNYCPVPKGFNSARSGFGVYDCINLMLEKIKEFYDSYKKDVTISKESKSIIMELIRYNKNEDTYNNVLEWLKGFGDWKTFVDKNYFQDYVDNKYELKKEWGNISWNNPSPKTLDECKKYCETVSKFIDLRTMRMYNVLIKKEK